MVRWLTLLLSLLCIEADAQQALYSKKITLSAKNFVDSIEVEWERSQVYLPVTIGGKTYRFLLDTGAAQSVVYADTPIEGSRPAGSSKQILAWTSVPAGISFSLLDAKGSLIVKDDGLYFTTGLVVSVR